MKNIILDIDSAGDDILAVLYAVSREDINLLGVTTVLGASGSIEQATKVALNTIALTEKTIPVYAGAGEPIGNVENEHGDPVNFDEELRWKFGDRLDAFNTAAEEPIKKAETQNAVDYMIDMIHKYPQEITLVTTGPLTNVALALEKDGEIADLVKEIYVLGGCFHIYGNITPVVEYNIFADPEAAKRVFCSEMKITLIPLDVCENNRYADGMMTRDHLSDLQYYGSGKVVDYITDKFPIYIDIWREYFQLGGFPMDDVITVAAAIDDSVCTYSDKVFVDVELEGSLSRGQTVAFFGRQINKYEMREHKNCRIAKTLDGKRFMNSFVDTIIDAGLIR